MTLQVESSGSLWGSVTGGASDLLALVGQYEAQKLNTRFLELENQNKSLDAILKTQNAQANAAAHTQGQSFSDWMKANPTMAAGLGVAALVLVYLAVR